MKSLNRVKYVEKGVTKEVYSPDNPPNFMQHLTSSIANADEIFDGGIYQCGYDTSGLPPVPTTRPNYGGHLLVCGSTSPGKRAVQLYIKDPSNGAGDEIWYRGYERSNKSWRTWQPLFSETKYEHTYYVTGSGVTSTGASIKIFAYIKVINTNSPRTSFSISYLSECPVLCTGLLWFDVVSSSVYSDRIILSSIQITNSKIYYTGTYVNDHSSSIARWTDNNFQVTWSSPPTGTWISSVAL